MTRTSFWLAATVVLAAAEPAAAVLVCTPTAAGPQTRVYEAADESSSSRLMDLRLPRSDWRMYLRPGSGKEQLEFAGYSSGEHLLTYVSSLDATSPRWAQASERGTRLGFVRVYDGQEGSDDAIRVRCSGGF